MKTIQVSQNQSIQTSNKLESFCKHLFKLNYIVSYPYADNILEGMANMIIKLSPETTSEELELIINKFVKGEKEYFANKGIQNIFLEIKQSKNSGSPNYKAFLNGELG